MCASYSHLARAFCGVFFILPNKTPTKTGRVYASQSRFVLKLNRYAIHANTPREREFNRVIRKNGCFSDFFESVHSIIVEVNLNVSVNRYSYQSIRKNTKNKKPIDRSYFFGDNVNIKTSKFRCCRFGSGVFRGKQIETGVEYHRRERFWIDVREFQLCFINWPIHKLLVDNNRDSGLIAFA